MVALLLAAQIAASRADTATYSSAAVRDLVTEAARVNRLVPKGLGGYRARMESEITFGMHDATGKDLAISLEQVASDVAWTRLGVFEQHVTGYRTQMVVGFASFAGVFRSSWAVPSLYGNRIALMWGRDTSRYRRQRDTSYIAIHPLADDREQFYRFSGGDTVEVLTVDNRQIRIVRIDVQLRHGVPAHSLLFGGEIDFDVDRKHIVRMSGAFYQGGAESGQTVGALGIHALYEVELVNGEVAKEYWLPAYQRLEIQIDAPLFGDSKVVNRIVTHFRDFEIIDPDTAAGAPGDTLRIVAHPLTWARRDTLDAFHDWQMQIGNATSTLSTDDFNAVGPDRNRSTGAPLFGLQGEEFSDFVRFNRIEGLFTGIGVRDKFRDVAPGLTLRALAGYAWAEGVVRGRVSAQLQQSNWTYALRAGRSLDLTNDFRASLDSGSSLAALFGADDYDYVDRYSAGGAVTRVFGKRIALIRVEAGWASDHGVSNHVALGPIGRSTFLANRGVDEGSYLRTAATLEWHPNQVGEDVSRPGLGASLSYLRGDGELTFQRVDFKARGTLNAGMWRFGTRLDAGAAFDAPPQQLFEIGGDQNLPAYDYKAFAGDRAAVLRGFAMYRFNVLTGPIVLRSGFALPGVSPAVFASVQGGWAGTSSEATRATINRLGEHIVRDSLSQPILTPVSAPMTRALGSFGGGITFFGGALGVGAARSFELIAKWKVQFMAGLYF